MIDIKFKEISCKCCKCEAVEARRSKHQDRYSLYCNNCGKFIRFASTEQKAIIKAREDWLKEHSE